MSNDLEGMKTGERIKIIRERKGLSRTVLAGLIGMSASWLKDIESGRRLPPRLPALVRIAEVLAVKDVAALAGTDLELGGASIPIASWSRIPHDAVPGIRDAVTDPMLILPQQTTPVDVTELAARTAHAWHIWHTSSQHRTDVGRLLPSLVHDGRIAARRTAGDQRRQVSAVLADLWALVQHEIVWASEPELAAVVADRAMTAAYDADRPEAIASGAWTLAMVRRGTGDLDGALTLAQDAAALLRPRLETGNDDLRGLYGALQLHAATTCARAGRDGAAWRHWDEANAIAQRLPDGYFHPWTMFGASNVALHAVSLGADLSKTASARERAEQIDPDSIPSVERRARLMVEIGRLYHHKKDYAATLEWLHRAYDISPDSVHFSPTARQMAADVVDRGGPLIKRRARLFAEKLGMPA